MKNILAIDVGNSNIVLGLYRGDELVHQWRIHTDKKKMLDEYADLIDSLLSKMGISPADIDVFAVSNVVPSLATLFFRMAHNHFQGESFFVDSDIKMNFTNGLDRPEELGADLIAAAAAAVKNHGSPCIIIDFGTATTITGVNSKGVFIGGAIAPGLAVSCEALYAYAPHLPRIKLERPPSVFGANTVHAMQSGIFSGYGHLIRGLVEEMKSELGDKTPVIATGGLAGTFDNGARLIDVVDPRLVLDGIKYLYSLNSSFE